MAGAMRLGTLAALLIAAPARAELIVTECGTVVPAGIAAALGADLDCSDVAEEESAVQLSNGGKIDLRGHTLVAAEEANGVRCCSGDTVCHCSVRSSVAGGRIVGGKYAVFSRGNVTVSGVTLEAVGGGVYSEGRATVSDLTVTDSGAFCVRGNRVKLTRLTCTNCATDGVVGDNIRGEDLSVTGCGGAGVDAFLGRVVLKRATITGNGHAPTPGHGSGGVLASKAVLIDVTATGNHAGPLLAPLGTPADVFTARKPRLRGSSSCERSAVTGNYTTTWDVCTAD